MILQAYLRRCTSSSKNFRLEGRSRILTLRGNVGGWLRSCMRGEKPIEFGDSAIQLKRNVVRHLQVNT